MKRSTLDNLLRDWAARHDLGADGVGPATARLAAELHRPSARQPTAAPMRPALFWFRLRWAAIGAVAVTVVLVTLCLVQRQAPPPDDRALAAGGGLDQARLLETLAVFREANRLFGPRLRWLEDSAQDVSLGIQEVPGGQDRRSASVVVVHLTLTSRPRATARWRADWVTTIMTRAEESVSLSQPARQLLLWTYPVNGNLIAVDTELAFPGAPKAVSTASIVEAGKPVHLFSFTTAETEFQLTAVALVVPAGGGA